MDINAAWHQRRRETHCPGGYQKCLQDQLRNAKPGASSECYRCDAINKCDQACVPHRRAEIHCHQTSLSAYDGGYERKC
jgi:hypothetical protein